MIIGLLGDPFLSSSTAEEITIVDEDDVDALVVPTLDENDNPPNLKQVVEKGKKNRRRLVSHANANELRLKDIERMKLLEEVKKRIGNTQGQY